MSTKFIVIISLTLFLCLAVSSAVFPKAPEGQVLHAVTLEKETVKGHVLFSYEHGLYLAFGESLDRSFESSEKDYGAQFSLVRIAGNEFSVLFQSKGSHDSYILQPTFFRAADGTGPLVILAETGTEYSWGARVFLVWPNGKAKDIGSLDVAVIEDPDMDTVSVIPYTRIRTLGKGYEFTFTRDVIFDPGGINDRPLKKNTIRYLYDGTTLTLVTNHQ